MSKLKLSNKVLALALCALALNACSGLGKQDCTSKDWYEIGRQDGSLGKQASEYDNHKASCDLKKPKFSSSLYKNGRNAGLVNYCSNSNAFLLGKALKPVPKVCPTLGRQNFLKHYKLGKRVNKLEGQKRTLDKKIISLTEKAERDPSSINTSSHLRKLRNKKAAINRKIEKFSEESIN